MNAVVHNVINIVNVKYSDDSLEVYVVSSVLIWRPCGFVGLSKMLFCLFLIKSLQMWSERVTEIWEPAWLCVMIILLMGLPLSPSLPRPVWAAEEQRKGLEFIIRDFPLEGAQRPKNMPISHYSHRRRIIFAHLHHRRRDLTCLEWALPCVSIPFQHRKLIQKCL